MSLQTISDIEIIKSTSSKINQIDFDALTFGSVFTDHMLVCDYRNGSWEKPTIQPYQPFTLDPSAKVFHYGQAIFEGMKAYKAEDNSVWLFRPQENHIRMNKSAVRMCMPEVPEFIFIDALKELLKIDEAWIEKGIGNTLYIRPFMIAIGSGVIAQPSSQYRFCVILSPARAYYSGDVKVMIADYYSRAANGGIGAAKAAGNYSGQFYPTKLANEAGFQQIIWTDDATHTQLEECGTMNVFFRINNTLLTAPTSDRILDGITRKTLITLAESKGIQVMVRPVFVSELIEAAKDGSLLEIFGAGTAAVVSPIKGFQYKEEYYELPTIDNSYAKQLKESLTFIQHKVTNDPFGWTVKI
ncbi:branched-chain amino acid aminotransferase [Flavobacterium columnare NBRC 100251 = ATCC 23463]|uniref:Branched-chain-amino-acid aminotransferase n=1 Tax=Flavobacterium columnare (strain ATCC 49512 / CIP 103533 / TG 44/87) TaxID=1041826 RepID=G8X7D5_FLACA|nr:branched-chain amino acid aminotransferase [Flavobacterium columnare]AEW84949.1 branched-chain amino acid aminotransferase [Flavobacterium columnare ATCC 49512]ANO48223.1 branched-chain amino acid aminotransferase [Flavobacterium columnare]APT21218.1 branched chain amino acid aminotransferase [Flavobacterium columnare]MBF6653373.1 branched-chain amino acid aminotransferase [Flavobacterium columnare]MBF6655397.1 branched-chain amino acid aminotransferase [Flavobacterium columnare]